MSSCPNCESSNVIRRGAYFNKTAQKEKQRYSCNDCDTAFSIDAVSQPSLIETASVYKGKKYVITSCQNDTEINEEFFESLQNYCGINKAELVVLRSKYNVFDDVEYGIDSEWFVDDNMDIGNHVRVYANLNIVPTAENPLSGLDALSKGKTLIVGHPQLQMRTLPVNENAHPIIMTTTGSISVPNYSNSKQGLKAEFNHSYSAIVLEVDTKNDIFHLRVLNCDDDNGFYDLDGYYTGDTYVRGNGASAIVIGDEHVIFADEEVVEATYTNKNSLINTVKPKIIVRHDVVDAYSISHHDRKNFLKIYKKHMDKQNILSDELAEVVRYLHLTTPKGVTNYIVDSNHHSHITRWLNEVNIKEEPQNAKFYHYMMFRMLDNIEKTGKIANPFEIYLREKVRVPIKFISSSSPEYIDGIDVANHGDRGANGSFFAPTGGAKMPSKMVVGHSHSPKIEKGCYVVGTMTKLMDYAKGCPTSWMNTHCVIYPNGKRQLINIIDGKFKL